MQSLQEHDSSVEYKVCTEQESLPNKDQKQSKRNYMSLLGRDVIAESGLVEHNLNQPASTKIPACAFRKKWHEAPAPPLVKGSCPFKHLLHRDDCGQKQKYHRKKKKARELPLLCGKVQPTNVKMQTICTKQDLNIVFNKYYIAA